MTWYLKYRPQTVAELDLVEVREHLARVLARGEIPHAFLFSGPRGVGKTSAARVVAKAINCTLSGSGQKIKSFEPCNKCEMCAAITAGSAPDVIEIDAASNRGIDEIRELKERIGLAPLAGKYKVYIIDEVHMLTAEAANALLKTLEEPPANVVFILCTTEAERLPATVVSRCAQIPFRQPSVAEIEAKLNRVIMGEKLKVREDEVKMIAKASGGSFRDAIKILEQVGADGETLTVLGMVEGASPEKFVELLKDQDVSGGLEFINNLVKKGVSVRGFIVRCVEHLRDQLLEDFGDDTKKTVLLKLIEGLERAYERVRSSAVVQLPLEILVIENGGQADPQPTVRPAPVKPFDKAQDRQMAKPKGEESSIKKVEVTDGKYQVGDVASRWVEIMSVVKPKNHSVEALLRSTRPVGWDGNKLTLEVFYQFHMDKLGSEKCRSIVESSVAEVFGMAVPVRLDLRLGEKKPAAADREKAPEEISGAVEEDIIRAAQEIFKVEAI